MREDYSTTAAAITATTTAEKPARTSVADGRVAQICQGCSGSRVPAAV